MAKISSRCPIEGLDLDAVYNRNEVTVRRELKKMLDASELDLTSKEISDVYALTLNDFPPHYVHSGTIVLFPKVHRDEVIRQIKRNVLFVQSRPKD